VDDEMTLAVAWERQVGDSSELLFASDSRVRQGGEWDACPKVFRLPRTDALMAFAGEALWTYPIVLQTIATMDAFEPTRSRRYNLRGARGHAMRSINAMMRAGSAPTGDLHSPAQFEFLFGGWSWQEQRFLLWRMYWDAKQHRIRHDRVLPSQVGVVRFIGTRDRATRDRSKKDEALEVVGKAKARLSALLREKHGRLGAPLDMEPWEVLLELLRSGDHPTLGGAPQLAKVYRYMDTRVFAVRWPDGDGALTLTGRELLSYEKTDAPIVDPDKPFGYEEQELDDSGRPT
jgi:hypothetical protein